MVEPVEETVAEFQSSMKQFSPNLPSIGNHFYPIYGAAGAFGTTTPEPTPEPYIDPTTPANVTVIKGKSAMLACVVREIGDAAVSTRFVGYASHPNRKFEWISFDSKQIFICLLQPSSPCIYFLAH